MELTAKHPDRPGFRPLYQQVRDLLLARISTGAWRPAEALPSEQALAVELGVSQGTVRKAIDALVADSLIERRQGKGTYVAQHTQESTQFRFFKLTDDDGERLVPSCREATIEKRPATPHECLQLEFAEGSEIYKVVRDRYCEDKPILRESIIVPALLFPLLDSHKPLPNTLYTFYQSSYGVSITGADEKIKAIAADGVTAKVLNIVEGSPLLQVERIARDMTGRPIEVRISLYPSSTCHYAVELG